MTPEETAEIISAMGKGMTDEIFQRGFDLEAAHRLAFRSLFVIKNVEKRIGVLKAGNLATWEPEVEMVNHNLQDLCDVTKELIFVLSLSFNAQEILRLKNLQKEILNQKEQEVAPPPNGAATPSDPA